MIDYWRIYIEQQQRFKFLHVCAILSTENLIGLIVKCLFINWKDKYERILKMINNNKIQIS